MSRISRKILAFPVLFLAAGVLLAQGKSAAKQFKVWPAADLKWVALEGAPPGPMLAVISGDPNKGPYKAIEKFPAGFSAPMHTHPANHSAVIISGTWIHGEPGKADVRLGPGSYLFQPAGMKHTTACDAASECVFYIESSGKFGITIAEEKAAAKN
jgi:Domain of unknown function (DUF4437)